VTRQIVLPLELQLLRRKPKDCAALQLEARRGYG
jgi:hypothetical protein